MYVIEQPLPATPAADSATNVLAECNAIYDAYNEVTCLILGSITHELHRQFENSSPYDVIQEHKSMLEKQAEVERFVRNYDMHNMGKTIGELHVMLIEYEKGLPKKAETPQVMTIKDGKIQKAKKKSLKAKGKSKANGKGNDKQIYIPKLKNPKPYAKEHLAKMTHATTVRSNGIYEIDMHDLVPNVNSIYNVSTKGAKHNLDSTYLWHCRLTHISKKRKMTKKLFPHHPKRVTDLLGIIHTDVCGPLRYVLRQGASYFITFTDDYSHYGYVYLLKHKHEDYALESATRILNIVSTKKVDKTPYELWYEKVLNLSYLKVWGCEALMKRDMLDKLQQRSVKCILTGYPKETMGYYFYFPPENKIVVTRYAEFFEKNLITQEVSGTAVDLEEIQEKDTSPSEITSEIPMEVEGFEPPQEEVILIRRSVKTHQAPNRLCQNVKLEDVTPPKWVAAE
nr:hypothetical protein [Tanacetum cinerariifolium]